MDNLTALSNVHNQFDGMKIPWTNMQCISTSLLSIAL